MAPQSPYRTGDDLVDLIPPDRRRRNAALLAFGCVIAGALIMRGGESLVAAAEWIGVGHLVPRDRAIALASASESAITPAPLAVIQGRAPAPTSLTVICFPACDHVVFDRRDLGASPIWRRATTPGEHTLRLSSVSTKKTKFL